MQSEFSFPPQVDEKRHQEHLKNAARVIFESSSEKAKADLRADYEAGNYQKVLDIAAEQDVPQREKLDSKIKMIPNPDFKESQPQELSEDVMNHLLNATLDKLLFSRYKIDQTEAEEMKKRLKEGRIYEVEDEEPRFLFVVEGVEGTFKSAAKAIAAYKEKNDLQDKKDHSFKRNPKFIDSEASPKEVVQAIPNKPEATGDIDG